MKNFVSPTKGLVTIEQMIARMSDFKKQHEGHGDLSIVIGTDSQNFSDTKMVSVIAMHCEGKGGIYFYKVEHLPKIKDVRQKLNTETQLSLQYADELIGTMMEQDEDLFAAVHFSIHVDAGNSDHGKTKELIPGIVGWIHASGYECQIKPDSFAASSIANKISK